MKRHRFLSLGVVPIAMGAVPARARAQSITAVQLSEELPWAGVPGASAAVVTAADISALDAGVVLQGALQPVVSRTVFEAASLSKPLFAFALLERLVATGVLDLDRPLSAYLAEPYGSPDPRLRAVTARHVLTHTSGLPNWRHSPTEPLTLAFAPGARFQYSGEGFYFLQTVVESLSGTGLAAFMRPTLDALGMADSDYVWRESYASLGAHPHDRNAAPIAWDSKTLGTQLLDLGRADGVPLRAWTTRRARAALRRTHPSRDALPWNAMPNAAWSLYTTATDYGQFVQALLQRPEHAMLRPAVQISRYLWRGLGIAVQVRDRRRVCYHTGANPGFKSAVFGDLAAGRGAVSFCNSDGGFPLNMHVIETIVGMQPAILELEQP